ncbi:type II restriction endonuclease [Photorhabdus luminescens]|uniref:NgoMIV family type II restriction endonuclease n=1 Tax=Photorhabdus akhurstii TaxID=171438 RepID=UPI000CF8E51D|nr:NgoMIV family type II restriction endonuclease [Photorhabdus akhurstii]MBS9429345.1 type II restriction endonuclease [Photorhabdus akhurstii]PQQ32075.1 type II restriction endonuclease [Photorhabdus luminescens]PQQ42449.1 type II restriction endonuclease [Photorhabdus luminescens]
MKGLISQQRDEFHRILIEQRTLAFSKFNKYGETRIASNADSGQRISVLLSNLLFDKLAHRLDIYPEISEKKKDGQTTGNEFEAACAKFLNDTFPTLDTLRPGKWSIAQVHHRSGAILGQFEQYSHLSELTILAQENKTLRNFLGDSYTVAPDVIISRKPEPDEDINQSIDVVDNLSSKNTMLREVNHKGNPHSLLHASISCKFTMRSDRAQNTRTEALNLIRTRKGRAPHITSVTAEPMASRIASLALGTGDMDYVYHFALYELLECCQELNLEESLELLTTMIDGKRLRDISDLPLDLAI